MNLHGILQIGVDLYNKLLGNTYAKSLPQLRYSWFYFYFNMYILGGLTKLNDTQPLANTYFTTQY